MTKTPPAMTPLVTEKESPAFADGDQEPFGAWLRREREMREIGLREIADSSKISLRYLQALEDERFDLLPAEVFAKGFLRQYAGYVGLDPEVAVGRFLAASGQDSEEEPTEVRSPERRTPGLAFALLALALAGLALVVVWGLSRLNQAGGEAPPPGSPPAAPEGALATPEETAPALQAPPASAAGAAAAPGPGPLVVILDFRDDCWVVARVDGELTEPGVTQRQGESRRFEARDHVALTLGNRHVVDLEVDGMPYNAPSSGGSVLRDHRIDRETARQLANRDRIAGETDDR